MAVKSKVIITKDHIINLIRFFKETDAITTYAQTYGNLASNTVAFFLTSNIASFHSSDNGANWTHSQNTTGPFGIVQYIPQNMETPRAIGQVNRHSANSTLLGIVSKDIAKAHDNYQKQNPAEKTAFGCMVNENNATPAEMAKMEPDSTESGSVGFQVTLTKQRNPLTYEMIAEHDPADDTNEENLNINWGDYESFKN